MATTITGTINNGGSIETSQIDETTLPQSQNEDMEVGNAEITSPAAKAENSSNIQILSTAIKTFVEKITELVTSLSKLLETLASGSLPASKKTKASVLKKVAKAAEKQAGITDAVKKKLDSDAKKINELATTTTENPTGGSGLANSITAKVAGSIAPVSPAVINRNNDSTVINPANGHSDEYLSVSTNRLGAPEIYTEDGFKLSFEGKDQAWNITSPQGKISRIWGDPHVTESDGDKWDFKERSSFIFGNNKVTIETIPFGKDQTLSSRVTIYNGDSRVSVSGIDKDTPVFEAVSRDAQIDDAIKEDGDVFILGSEANGEDQFILLKDAGEKFSQEFSKQVGVGNLALKEKYLTNQQIAGLK